MKKILFVLVALTSVSAFASEAYNCTDVKNSKKGFDLNFENTKSVSVTDNDGDEYSLAITKNTSRNVVYGNYEYDGYGGSIELLLPKNFTTSGSEAIEEFKATLTRETYSELGHVGTDKMAAKCQRVDN